MEELVLSMQDDLNALVRLEFVAHDETRLVPDILKNGDDLDDWSWDSGREHTKVFFSDTEDARMYISTKGFLNTEDADEEVKKVFDGLDEYKNAKTVIEHIRCFQDSI